MTAPQTFVPAAVQLKAQADCPHQLRVRNDAHFGRQQRRIEGAHHGGGRVGIPRDQLKLFSHFLTSFFTSFYSFFRVIFYIAILALSLKPSNSAPWFKHCRCVVAGTESERAEHPALAQKMKMLDNSCKNPFSVRAISSTLLHLSCPLHDFVVNKSAAPITVS